MRLRIVFRISCMVLSLLFLDSYSPAFGKKAANIAASTQEITTIHLTMKGTYLIVDAKLNGRIRKFILDGSSDRTLLNSKYIYREAGISGKLKSFPEQTANRMIRKNNRIDFYGTKLNRSDIETMDMTYIEDATGVKVYGIIGYDLIKNYDLVINYKEQTITLFNPRENKGAVSPPYKSKTKWMLPFIPL